MTPRPSKDEQKIINVIERLPFTTEDKTAWIEIINNSGMNEEMIKEIFSKLSALPKGEDTLSQARLTAEFNRLIRSWRLTSNLGGGRHKH